MAFTDSFDSFKEKAAEVAVSAAKKTKQLAEISKANIAIYSLEDKIKKAETELGKLYYRKRGHMGSISENTVINKAYKKYNTAALFFLPTKEAFFSKIKNGGFF